MANPNLLLKHIVVVCINCTGNNFCHLQKLSNVYFVYYMKTTSYLPSYTPFNTAQFQLFAY